MQYDLLFRDVKPANIMRTSRGRLYLIDFGIARLFNPQKTRDTGPLGSPGFAAPEQYGKAQSTIQTDIYGLGATLEALLQGPETGEQPPPDEPINEPAQGATKATGTPTVPRSLQKLLDQMLELDATKRPRNMQEVQRRLELLPINILRLLLSVFQRSFWGLFIGSLPYSLVLCSYLLFPIPLIGQMFGWFMLLIALLFFGLWFLVLGAQLTIAIPLLFSQRHRYMGIGILVMLGGLCLAAAAGWLPWPWNVLPSIFPFHFRIT
jgi:serine/threonine protein kinase